MSDEQPDAIPWYKDKTFRAVATPAVAVILRIVQINAGKWIVAHTGLAINTWTADNVMTYIVAAATLGSGWYLAHRRVVHGKDPANPAPLITGGAIAQKVIGAVPKSENPDEFQRIVDTLAAPHEPEILKVESDPESPRLTPPSKPASHGMSDEDLVDLIRKSGQKRPSGEGQAPLP